MTRSDVVNEVIVWVLDDDRGYPGVTVEVSPRDGRNRNRSKVRETRRRATEVWANDRVAQGLHVSAADIANLAEQHLMLRARSLVLNVLNRASTIKDGGEGIKPRAVRAREAAAGRAAAGRRELLASDLVRSGQTAARIDEPGREPSPHAPLVQRAAKSLVHDALAALAEDDRDVLVAMAEGETLAQCASRLGVSRSTARVQRNRAKEALRRAIVRLKIRRLGARLVYVFLPPLA